MADNGDGPALYVRADLNRRTGLGERIEGTVVADSELGPSLYARAYGEHFTHVVLPGMNGGAVKKAKQEAPERADIKMLPYNGDIAGYEHNEGLPPVKLFDVTIHEPWSADLDRRVASLCERFPNAHVRVTVDASADRYDFDRTQDLRGLPEQVPYSLDNQPKQILQFNPAQ